MMDQPQRTVRSGVVLFLSAAAAWAPIGCGPTYRELRVQGQQAVLRGEYGPARYIFQQADEKSRNRPANLHDMALCSFMLSKRKFERSNRAAAMREVDAAIEYYSRAIDSHPGHQASIVGKNLALELKGQFDEALAHAEWAAAFVGPSATQHLFLAKELEERGDTDGALLRYSQAVALDPRHAGAHAEFGGFLLRHGNEAAAIDHLRAAYRLNPRIEWVARELTARGKLPPLTSERADPQ